MAKKRSKKNGLPAGWDEQRVRNVLAHYEDQSDADAVAEDEAPFARPTQTVMKIPRKLVPAVREMIALDGEE